MIRAILWKEWREQRIVAAAVLSFGALALYLTAQFADEGKGSSIVDGGGPRELMAVALAYLAGAVSGAILLADEKEVGTLEFLDTLPSRRRTIWIGKAIAGGVLTLGQSVLLALLAIVLDSTDNRLGPLAYGFVVILVGVLSFAWGMFGGALARSTLGAVFQGSIALFMAGLVLAIPFTIVFGPRGLGQPFGLPLLLYYGCWVAAGLFGSAIFFTGVDRQRFAARGRPAAIAARPRKPWLAGLRALTWLTVRQAVFVAVGAGAAGLLVGAVMLAPDSQPLFAWPGATLAIGVLAGVTTMGEEQVRGVARFWAERRLPLGRLWLVKTGYHFAIAFAAALVLAVFIFAASPALPFRSRLLVELRPETGRFLTIGMVYGFVVGHLTGMLFRKTIVAGLVATVTASTLVALILPLVIGGGASAWQVWAPAGILLLTDRLFLYPWATDRVAMRGPVFRAAGGVTIALTVLGAGIAYRVAEIPATPDRLAESDFAEGLPSFDANNVGQKIKAAASQYRLAALDAQSLYPGQRAPTNARRGGLAAEGGDPLNRTIRVGWTSDSAALEPWLDRVFAADWPRLLDEMAGLPAGVYEDPRELDYFMPPDSFQNLKDMTYVLRVRGIQRQVAGDPAAFPRLIRSGLAAARTARNRGGLVSVETAFECEQVLLGGVAEWLDRLDGRPDLLRALLVELGRHETEMPIGAVDAFWAEQLILRNTMDRIGSWLPRLLDPNAGNLEGTDAKAEAEANLVAFAWHVPWERARRERLLRAQTERPVNPRLLSALHLPNLWRLGFDRADGVVAADRRAVMYRHFARLQVALQLYDLEHGTPAQALASLVPKYLPAVPEDPYTGQPFGYRLSTGELIAAGNVLIARDDFLACGLAGSLANPIGGLNGLWVISRMASQPPTRGAALLNPPVSLYQVVPAGYGILWSGGPDGRDDGGRRTGPRGIYVSPGDDWIVVIPPAGRRRE